MIDFTKPVQTRSGIPVTILTTQVRGSRYPVIGYLGQETIFSEWTSDGRWLYSSRDPNPKDIINVPEKRTAYVNIVKGAKRVRLYRTAQEAASAFDQDGPLIARVKIEYTEGQRDE